MTDIPLNEWTLVRCVCGRYQANAYVTEMPSDGVVLRCPDCPPREDGKPSFRVPGGMFDNEDYPKPDPTGWTGPTVLT